MLEIYAAPMRSVGQHMKSPYSQNEYGFSARIGPTGGEVPVQVTLGDLGLVTVTIKSELDTRQDLLPCKVQVGEFGSLRGEVPLYATAVVKLFDPRKQGYASAADALFAGIGAPVALDESETEIMLAEILLYRFHS